MNPTSAVAFAGGMVAFVGGLVGQTDSVATGTLIGGAGLAAALTALAKGFWDDRKDSRQTELERLRIERTVGNRRAIRQLHAWVVEARRTNPSLPPAPDLIDLVEEDNSSGVGPA